MQAGKFETPMPCLLPPADVEKLAERSAALLGYKPNGDIFAAAERLGGRIRPGSVSDASKQSGSVVAKTAYDWTMYLSPIAMPARDRFTIAHDIGHLCLHLPQCKQRSPQAVMRAGRYSADMSQAGAQAEREADWFAMAFLMPAAEFEKLFKQAGKATCSLRFGVSGLAVRARAQMLGLGRFLQE